jgi:transposase
MAITNAKRLVFLDESFCSTGMRRDYGRAARGLRVFGEKPGGRWKTLSLIGAIRLGARPKLMTYVGAVNGAVFLRFVTQRLVPWLRRGDVVVMDNLNTHKMTKVRAAIEVAGAAPVYLPTYSPELNPIETVVGGPQTTSPKARGRKSGGYILRCNPFTRDVLKAGLASCLSAVGAEISRG